MNPQKKRKVLLSLAYSSSTINIKLSQEGFCAESPVSRAELDSISEPCGTEEEGDVQAFWDLQSQTGGCILIFISGYKVYRILFIPEFLLNVVINALHFFYVPLSLLNSL